LRHSFHRFAQGLTDFANPMRTFVGLCRLHVDYETVENTTKTQNTLSKVIVLVGLATVGAAAEAWRLFASAD
jgi:hypothetical protein